MDINLDDVSNDDLISLYSDVTKELKERKIVKTKNILGDLGENLAIKHYCNRPDLPNLYDEKVGKENIDARDENNKTYSIKSISTNITGVFRGIDTTQPSIQLFDFVIICKFDQNCELEAIYQLTWDKFRENKHWQKRVSAWYLILSKKLIQDSVTIYKRESK